MYKKLLSLPLAVAVLIFVCTNTTGQSAVSTQADVAVKREVERLGIGSEVEVKLRDKSKKRGLIQQIGPDYFVIADTKKVFTTDVSYSAVQQIKQIKHHHLSEGKLTAIAVVVLIVLFTLANSTNKP